VPRIVYRVASGNSAVLFSKNYRRVLGHKALGFNL
jgi:hypothetical protein